MRYNEPISYNSSNVTYNGTILIYASSLINPIVLNNITVFYANNEDYSNSTTIGVLSIDVNPEGIISIEVLDEDVSAIASAQVISITTNGEVSILG
jgi:hypothetical protein